MDEWRVRKAPGIIETTALGSCVGIIIYDSLSKEAFVGHFADPRIGFENMLYEIEQRFPNS